MLLQVWFMAPTPSGSQLEKPEASTPSCDFLSLNLPGMRSPGDLSAQWGWELMGIGCILGDCDLLDGGGVRGEEITYIWKAPRSCLSCRFRDQTLSRKSLDFRLDWGPWTCEGFKSDTDLSLSVWLCRVHTAQFQESPFTSSMSKEIETQS
jgi:hypothetical protein